MLGAAGRWTDPFLLGYVATWSALALLGLAIIDPDVSRARLKKGPLGVDPVSPRIFRVCAVGHLVLGVLDVGRLHWSDSVPPAVRLAALGVMAAAFAFVLWAISVNQFFIPAVRIQEERGHRLITDGPYRWVRHPGYAGLLVGVPASALALGSWWSLAVALVMAVFVLRRASLEDRYLRANLAGYPNYAGEVRARLVPGLW